MQYVFVVYLVVIVIVGNVGLVIIYVNICCYWLALYMGLFNVYLIMGRTYCVQTCLHMWTPVFRCVALALNIGVGCGLNPKLMASAYFNM